MEPTSLKRLLEEDGVTCTPEGLILKIHPDWVIEGEDRLSYTTLIRLIECCREHHWNTDILSRANGTLVDATSKSIAGEFTRSILVGSAIAITYQVTEVRSKGYALKFEVRDALEQTLYATFKMVSVFYDAQSGKAVPPPQVVFN
ncbi:MAG: acyl-CoA thioesterase, partial [Microcystaceae cyanobacterium]